MIRIDQPDLYTLRFVSDNGFMLRADCNRGGGTYTREENRLGLQVTRVTRAACPPGSLSDDYLRHLNEVYGFRAEGVFLSFASLSWVWWPLARDQTKTWQSHITTLCLGMGRLLPFMEFLVPRKKFWLKLLKMRATTEEEEVYI
jgi:hypothetical protein